MRAFLSFAVAAGLVFSLPSASASAAAPAPPAAKKSADKGQGPPRLKELLQGDARDAFERASLLFEDGNYPAARAEYDRAYQLSREPRVLYNVAACDKALRRYARAASVLKQSIAEKERVPAEHVALVEETLAVLAPFIGKIEVEGELAGAAVKVDDEVVGETPLVAPLEVDVGEHVVVIEKPGYVPQNARIMVTFDAPGKVKMALAPIETKPAEPILVEKKARLRVQTDNEKNAIYIDDKLAGAGSYVGTIKPGRHALRVEREGAKRYTAIVELEPGETRALDVTLPENSGVPKWVWFAGGAALLAGAGVLVGVALAPTEYKGSGAGTLPPRVVPAGFSFGGARW